MRHKKIFRACLFSLLFFSGMLFLVFNVSSPLFIRNSISQATQAADKTAEEEPDSEHVKEPAGDYRTAAESCNPCTGHSPSAPKSEISTGGLSTPLSANRMVFPSGYGIPEWGHIHRYRDGVCTVCGSAPDLHTDFLPIEFYTETENAGTVYLHEYESPAYEDQQHATYEQRINIYLPYGYDESTPYNVLVLVHGGGGNQDSWLNDVYYYDEGIQMRGRVIFDNMFEQGICDPCIIVCPVTEIPQCQGIVSSTVQLRQELREYILPYLAEHYSTYAADGRLDSLKAARDHFGLGGLSNGALFVYEGGMCYNFDLFGSYAAFSGNGSPWETVNTIQQSSEYSQLPINCYFTGAGTVNDWQIDFTRNGYNYFVEQLPQLEEGKNAWHVDVNGGHEWKVWFTDIFNALPLMFPS